MDIHPGGSRPSRRASGEYFTGTVWQDSIVEAPAPARVRALLVSFEPGARTNWHTHPLGQTLYVVSGTGRVQSFGGPLREVRAGAVPMLLLRRKPDNVAGPTTTMVHIAIQESLDGKTVDWLEKVTEEQYKAAAGG